MVGHRPNIYFRWCWKFISPVIILVRERFITAGKISKLFPPVIHNFSKGILLTRNFEKKERKYATITGIMQAFKEPDASEG